MIVLPCVDSFLDPRHKWHAQDKEEEAAAAQAASEGLNNSGEAED